MSKKISYELLSSLRDELNAIVGDATEEIEAPKKSKKSTTSAEDDFDYMSYNDLKKMCKAKGLSAAGNREELAKLLFCVDNPLGTKTDQRFAGSVEPAASRPQQTKL